MTTILKSFTSVEAGPSFLVKQGESFDFSLTGTFVATIILERSRDGVSYAPVRTLTAPSSGLIYVQVSDGNGAYYRFRCSAFTSGTAVTSMVDINRLARKLIIPAGAVGKVGSTGGWIVTMGDNVNLATLPASQAASTLVVPVIGLKEGDRIVGLHLIGQIESAGNVVTLDADLRKQTAVAADVTDASVATITQVSVTADAKVDEVNSNEAQQPAEDVGQDETFYVLITGTTGASTDVALQGVAIDILSEENK